MEQSITYAEGQIGVEMETLHMDYSNTNYIEFIVPDTSLKVTIHKDGTGHIENMANRFMSIVTGQPSESGHGLDYSEDFSVIKFGSELTEMDAFDDGETEYCAVKAMQVFVHSDDNIPSPYTFTFFDGGAVMVYRYVKLPNSDKQIRTAELLVMPVDHDYKVCDPLDDSQLYELFGDDFANC